MPGTASKYERTQRFFCKMLYRQYGETMGKLSFYSVERLPSELSGIYNKNTACLINSVSLCMTLDLKEIIKNISNSACFVQMKSFLLTQQNRFLLSVNLTLYLSFIPIQ